MSMQRVLSVKETYSLLLQYNSVREFIFHALGIYEVLGPLVSNMV